MGIADVKFGAKDAKEKNKVIKRLFIDEVTKKFKDNCGWSWKQIIGSVHVQRLQ